MHMRVRAYACVHTHGLCTCVPAGFGADHHAASAALDAHVAATVAAQLAKAAAAPEPARRPLAVPPLAAIGQLMCPEEGVVLGQLRAKREEVQRVSTTGCVHACACVHAPVTRHRSHTRPHAHTHHTTLPAR